MKRVRTGFTLVELIVVMGVISVLVGISLPALNGARQAARRVVSKSNLRQIASVVSLYECDNGKYPPTVAYMELGGPRTWLEPTTLINYEFTGPRSISHYLRPYIENASVMYCPCAPRDYSYMQDAWDAGDNWDNPDTARIQDPLFGTYSFWWNYKGYLSEKRRIFEGPDKSDCSGRKSELVASCFFGTTPNPYNQLDYGDYISCERFKKAGRTPQYSVSSQLWNRMDSSGITREEIRIKLNAAYTDGHVEQFNAAKTTTLKISMRPNGGPYYFPDYIRGDVYLPEKAIR